MCVCCVPKNRAKHRVHGKGAWIQVVDIPDASVDVMMTVAMMRLMNGVVYRCGDGQGPGKYRKDLVSGDFARSMRLAPTERIDCE